MNHATATPIELDTELAALAIRGLINDRTWSYTERALHKYNGTIVEDETRYHFGYVRKAPTFTATTAEALAGLAKQIERTQEFVATTAELHEAGSYTAYSADLAAAELELMPWDLSYAERTYEAAEACVAEADAIAAAEAPIHEQWFARNGWTRMWMVTSSSGHIHSSQSCSTCHKGKMPTTFGLVPSLSGLTEAEAIVALEEIRAGYSNTLCSTCYPDAPVIAKRTNVTKAQATKIVGHNVI